MKKCKECKEEKNIEDFYKHKGMADGHLSICKDCKVKYSVNYYKDNQDKIKKYYSIPLVAERRKKNKRQWNIDNKIYNSEYRKRTKLDRNEQRRKRYKNDPEYRILSLLRSRLYYALKGICKSDSTIKLLGCSVEKLMIHLESLFEEGMTWNNQGEWEIDHIKPCDSFDLTDPVQQRKCFNYINLQPMWKADNIRKGNKY